MNKGRRPSRKFLIALILAWIIVIVTVVLVVGRGSLFAHPKESPSPAAAEGLRFIREQETVKTEPIEEQIFREDHQVSVEELLKQFDKDPDSIWKTLKEYDVLFMGDSRAQGFLIYDFMDDPHCLVMHSTTIYTIKELIGDVEQRKPRIILISYGINDVGLYHDNGVEHYMKDFAGLIDDLKAVDPGVIIYVNSILPCLESEYDRAPNWMAIPDWNKYIKNYCKKHGIGYIDATQLCKEHEDLYIDDGVHLVEEFYPYWGALIAAQIVSDLSALPPSETETP